MSTTETRSQEKKMKNDQLERVVRGILGVSDAGATPPNLKDEWQRRTDTKQLFDLTLLLNAELPSASAAKLAQLRQCGECFPAVDAELS